MQQPMDNVLIVVAHPDDEVLGAGGLAHQLSSAGKQVTACIASGAVEARSRRPLDFELTDDIFAAADVLGMNHPIVGSFPNIQINTVPHLRLVQFVEQAVIQTGARSLFTHHPGDLNDDHRQVSRACQAAARLPQRRDGLPSIEGLYYMEVPSSTDWAFADNSLPFSPNAFFALGEEDVQHKLKALACYRDVMREAPHPRSEEVLRGLAHIRGAQAGSRFAESFQVGYVNLNG